MNINKRVLNGKVKENNIKFDHVNRDICRIHLTKFHDIGVENVTNLYGFAGIYEICGI